MPAGCLFAYVTYRNVAANPLPFKRLGVFLSEIVTESQGLLASGYRPRPARTRVPSRAVRPFRVCVLGCAVFSLHRVRRSVFSLCSLCFPGHSGGRTVWPRSRRCSRHLLRALCVGRHGWVSLSGLASSHPVVLYMRADVPRSRPCVCPPTAGPGSCSGGPRSTNLRAGPRVPLPPVIYTCARPSRSLPRVLTWLSLCAPVPYFPFWIRTPVPLGEAILMSSLELGPLCKDPASKHSRVLRFWG